MKPFIIPIICIFLCQLGTSQEKFDLDQAIAYAQEHHSLYKNNKLDIQDADAQIKEFKAIGIPNITAGVDYQYFFIRPDQAVEDFISPAVYGVLFQEQVLTPRELGDPDVFQFSFTRRNNLTGYVRLRTLLFDANYLNGLKAARLFKELTAISTKVSERDLNANITKAFIATLVAKENLSIVEKNIKNLDDLFKGTKYTYDNGFIEQLDVDRVQLALENLKIEKENIEKVIELSENGLKFQMYYPLDQEIEIVGDLDVELAKITLGYDRKGNLDFSNRPEYDVISKAIELDKADEKRLKNGWLPSLRASAGVQESVQRDNLFDSAESGLLPSGNVALGLSMPIFDGNERRAQLQRTRIRLDKKKLEFEDFKRGMEIQVQNAEVNFQNAINNMSNRKRALDLNEKIYNTTLIKYKEGVGSSFELSLAESDFFQAEGAYISAIYDVILGKTELDIALGNIK